MRFASTRLKKMATIRVQPCHALHISSCHTDSLNRVQSCNLSAAGSSFFASRMEGCGMERDGEVREGCSSGTLSLRCEDGTSVSGRVMQETPRAQRSSSGLQFLRERVNVVPARASQWKEAVLALQKSQLIAVPTDTLYGLACDACSADAIQRIYNIKVRSAASPLAVCVADVVDVSSYGEISHLPSGLLESLLPGAVTLLLPRGESTLLSSTLNPGMGSIGIRIPDNDFIRGVSRSFGGALALTSANISTHLSTVRVEEFEHLWPHCALVFDAGALPAGRAGSTIVDLTREGAFKVIRSGSVLQETTETLVKFGLREL